MWASSCACWGRSPSYRETTLEGEPCSLPPPPPLLGSHLDWPGWAGVWGSGARGGLRGSRRRREEVDHPGCVQSSSGWGDPSQARTPATPQTALPRKPCPKVSPKKWEGPPPPAHIDDSLLGLCHVGDDPVRDDEQHRVLGAVLHRGRRPGGRGPQSVWPALCPSLPPRHFGGGNSLAGGESL